MKAVIVMLLPIFSFTGCSFIPDYKRPSITPPLTWDTSHTEQDPSAIAYDWWTSFGSQTLNILMTQALDNNTNLKAGIQRIKQARAALKIAGASLMPSVDSSAQAERSQLHPKTGKDIYTTSLGAGLNVSYELDLFGSNRANTQAAEAGYQGSLHDQEALKLSLMGDVATGYFTLLNLRERLVIANNNLDNAREVLRIMEARVREGAGSDLELSQQKSSVAITDASRVSLIEKIHNAENALATLLGQPPQSITVEEHTLDGLNIPHIALVQPSVLLERRPDLRSIESDLLVANADIGAARAAFFPSISLGLSDSLAVAGFGDPSSTILSLASSITVPIFKGGRLAGSLEQATARQLELVENYRGNVLNAFQEVDDALASVNAAQEREVALLTAMKQSRRAYHLSKKRYDAGSIDYQTLLDTQNAQLSSEDNYAQAKLARFTAAVNLYRVLGGGWTS